MLYCIKLYYTTFYSILDEHKKCNKLFFGTNIKNLSCDTSLQNTKTLTRDVSWAHLSLR